MNGNVDWASKPLTRPLADHLSIEKRRAASTVITTYVRPVLDVTRFNRFPPAARERELKKAADVFACSGMNVFVHYVAPIFDKRRTEVLLGGKTKKYNTKSTTQLWHSLEDDLPQEYFFWNELIARQLRIRLSDGRLTHEECLKDAGMLEDQTDCVWHAELAVCQYLGLPLPAPLDDLAPISDQDESNCSEAAERDATIVSMKDGMLPTFVRTITLDDIKDIALEVADEKLLSKGVQPDTVTNAESPEALLDTLPDRFCYEPRILYSHFAHYNLSEVRKAEGKHQTAMLRQLANLLDKTVRIFFYYYIVHRLCKMYYPPRDGSTVTSKAGDVWRFLPGQQKDWWCAASSAMKKRLRDGDVGGLEVLGLGSLEGEVLRLHGMAEAALESREAWTG